MFPDTSPNTLPPRVLAVIKDTLAMEMVCCSMTSWMAVRSASAILSNSSMQQMPRSARTKAPPSRVISPVRGSRITAAVRPTPDEPRPVVYWPEQQTGNKKKLQLAVDQTVTTSSFTQNKTSNYMTGCWHSKLCIKTKSECSNQTIPPEVKPSQCRT